MNIRGMQGGFKEAMAKAKVIEPTVEAIIDYLTESGVIEALFFNRTVGFTAEDVLIKKSVYDSRNDWNTHMVLLCGFPVAYTDSNI